MKGKGTTDIRILELKVRSAILVLWIWRNLLIGCQEVISRAIRKLRVEEWVVSAVMSMYTGAKQSSEQFMVIAKVLR